MRSITICIVVSAVFEPLVMMVERTVPLFLGAEISDLLPLLLNPMRSTLPVLLESPLNLKEIGDIVLFHSLPTVRLIVKTSPTIL